MRTIVACACAALCGLAGGAAPAGETKPKPPAGAAALASAVGTVLARTGAGGAWRKPALGEPVQAGEHLLTLPGARGVLAAKDGTRLTLQGNLPGLSSTPVLETALVVNAPGERAFDVTLERGLLILQAPRAPAAARVRVGKTDVDVTLAAKETQVAVETFSYWPVGSAFVKKPEKGRAPERAVFFFVLKGRAAVELQGEKHNLEGPVVYHWTSARGAVEGPLPLEKAPKWLDPGADTSKPAAELHKAVEKMRRLIADKAPAEAVEALAGDKSPAAQAVAVYSAAALGEAARVLDALHAPQAVAREAAVVALRHHAGRGQAEDFQVYDALLKHKYTPGQAEIAMYLLRGIGAEARQEPETYDALIRYLGHDQPGLRELAAWNLTRLVPQGGRIGYDAAGSAEARAQAQAAWRKLIPEGKLPPSK